MRRTTRLAASLFAVGLLLISWAPRAAAVGNSDAAKRAAAYVAGQAATVTDAGVAADSLLALAAGGDATLGPQATQFLNTVNTGAAAYAGASPEGAAKLLVAVVAVGQDPRNVNGLNLVDTVKAGVHPDGSFGSTPGTAASAWGMLALHRADEQIPSDALAYLVKLANADGGFGPAAGQASDAASTGLALQALATQTDSISAREATNKAVTWATAQQRADGSWAGGSAPLSTGLLGAGLQAAGQPQAKAVQYLVTQQQANGSLPIEATSPPVDPTPQATLLLGDTTYLTVSSPGLIAAQPSVAPTATATAEPTASETATPTESETATPTPAPNPLGDGNNILWVLLPIVLIALLAGGFYYLFIRPTRPPKDKAKGKSGTSGATPAPPAPTAADPTTTPSDPATPAADGDAPASGPAAPSGDGDAPQAP